jgi:hypothetical protein
MPKDTRLNNVILTPWVLPNLTAFSFFQTKNAIVAKDSGHPPRLKRNSIAELGIEAPCFDLNSACSSFVVQLWTLSHMDTRRLPDFILLVQPENLTRTVDYTDKQMRCSWGSE